ncbi:MAG: outer membrane protein transport protein [Flavobacteriaceae bacterium]|nr:outer membrane protein transport protein [Flavobacteriaceae bacterium]
MKRNLILLMALLVFPSAIYAGGYRVSLQGVRQAALGAQGAVLSHDASVAFYNPAALAFVDSKFSIAAGGFGVSLTGKYQNRLTGETAETDNPLGTPIYAAVSYKPTEKLALGVSFTTPFGSTVDWGNEWAGKYVINRIELKSYFLQPTVSYRFNDWFGVGVGYILASGSVNIQREVAVGNSDASLELNSKDGKGTGFNIGAYIKPHETVTVGIAYRSKVEMEVEGGDVMWQNVPGLVSSSMPFAATQFDAALPLPYEAIFGLSWQATPKLMLLGEVGSVGWEEYRELDIAFTGGNTPYNSVSTQKYDHTYNYSFGAEYAATDMFDLRLGYKYDSTPSPAEYFNPQTPTTDYHSFTLGLGTHFGGFNLDLMGQYTMGEERTFKNVESGFGGDLRLNGFIFGAGVSYNLQ